MAYIFFVLLFALSYATATPGDAPYEAPREESRETASQSHQEVSVNPVREEREEAPVPTGEVYAVIRAIDGDTIEVLINGEKKTIRYIGINTPETVHPSKPAECFGKEASDRNKALVEGKAVRLEKDVSETDKYGRLLRYVYVGDMMINEALVEGGYAFVSTYPPDVAHTETFRAAEVRAREAARGLWGDTCIDTTTSSAPVSAPASEATPSGQCTIKGNINAEDEKIYHVIGCQSYTKTVIDESTGEQWFCTEKEALDAGWRKALNC